MKKSCKILFSILILLICIIFLIFVFNNNHKTNINDINKNELSISKEISNITFTNIDFSYENEETIIEMKIFNKNNNDIKLNEYIINIYDKDNNLLGTLNPVNNSVIEKNNNIFVKVSKKEKYDNAYSLDFKLPNLEFIED